MKQIAAKFVPKLLTYDLKQHLSWKSVWCFRRMSKLTRRVYRYDPEIKQLFWWKSLFTLTVKSSQGQKPHGTKVDFFFFVLQWSPHSVRNWPLHVRTAAWSCDVLRWHTPEQPVAPLQHIYAHFFGFVTVSGVQKHGGHPTLHCLPALTSCNFLFSFPKMKGANL